MTKGNMDAKLPLLVLALLAFAFVLGGCTGPAAPGESNSTLASAGGAPSTSNTSASASGSNTTSNAPLEQPFRAPEQCIFDQAGFVCGHPSLTTDGRLSVNITNGQKRNIKISGIACVNGRKLPNIDIQTWPIYAQVSKTIGYTETINLGAFRDDAGNQFNVQCTDITTDENSGATTLPYQPQLQLEQNQDFSGRIYVAYKYADEPSDFPPKIVAAVLVVRVE